MTLEMTGGGVRRTEEGTRRVLERGELVWGVKVELAMARATARGRNSTTISSGRSFGWGGEGVGDDRLRRGRGGATQGRISFGGGRASRVRRRSSSEESGSPSDFIAAEAPMLAAPSRPRVRECPLCAARPRLTPSALPGLGLQALHSVIRKMV